MFKFTRLEIAGLLVRLRLHRSGRGGIGLRHIGPDYISELGSV